MSTIQTSETSYQLWSPRRTRLHAPRYSDERTEAFELYEALRRLQRQGAAGEILSATNPLLASPYYDGDWDEDEDD
jgi:hypothetical protein